MSHTEKCKKLVNSVGECVDECLSGLVAANPGLQQLEGHRVVVRADVLSLVEAGKVTIVSGGGSGHEPAHAGYIGEGMLSAAVAGSVFASPPPASILAGIRAIGKNNSGGVLVVVKNYTGDRLNFGLAVERAKGEGIKVDMVVVGEDCALTSTDKTAGRRGLCGTVLIHKIAGAMAQKGCSLEEIVKVVLDATTKMGTIGLSLTPCSVPGSGPSFQLASDEMELGLGIHGEAGVKRMKLQSAKDAVKTMFDHMTSPKTSTHLELPKGERVALVVNNLGGTSMLELNIVAKEAIAYLESAGVSVDRIYCGTFMTSLEMAGISLTVLRLNDHLRECLDAPTSAPAWQHPLMDPRTTVRSTSMVLKLKGDSRRVSSSTDSPRQRLTLSQADARRMFTILQGVGNSLVSAEEHLNNLDQQSGDGDCGRTLSRGAKGLLDQLDSSDSPGLPVDCPSQCAEALSDIAENVMGGSSGALYSIFLTAASGPLQNGVEAVDWVRALQAGIDAIMRYGGAQPGQRTMLDPLHAASTVLTDQMTSRQIDKSPVEIFRSAVMAAESAAEATTTMAAQAGRASYVSAEHLTKPDPGAVAVAIWMKAVFENLA